MTVEHATTRRRFWLCAAIGLFTLSAALHALGINRHLAAAAFCVTGLLYAQSCLYAGWLARHEAQPLVRAGDA